MKIHLIVLLLLTGWGTAFGSNSEKTIQHSYSCCSKSDVSIKLVLFTDGTFTYNSPGLSTVNGNWVKTANGFRLNSVGRTDYHRRWKYSGDCVKSRRALNFIRICNV